MAVEAGIPMTECRILAEGGRHHFMTRRFDRGPRGQKTHMQSLGGMAHLDFNQPGAHSYEQALAVAGQLALPMASKEELFRRMVFNVVARNHDDHVKNIALLMDRGGTWSLSPAFDVMYSYNPRGSWTARHQMTLNGKRDHFEVADLVRDAVRRWAEFAEAAGVPRERADAIGRVHRLTVSGGGRIGS